MAVYRIDPHVHCRDGKQAYKATIKGVLALARKQGVEKICDMPNTDPPILVGRDVEARLGLVPASREGDYFMYIGATREQGQLEEAVRCVKKYPEVVGIKMFAGKSIGDLAIIEKEGQRAVYRALVGLGYQGPLFTHCEKESEMKPEVWNPQEPYTHCLARPKEAEIESVRDQIELAGEEGFQGTLHVCHISCPEAVELVEKARNNGSIRVSCGVTPHHLMWGMWKMKEEEGLLYKMNPPPRNGGDVVGLREMVKQGKVDWVETDHAPHTREEKLGPPYLSGYPSLELYREFVEVFLPKLGLSQERIEAMTYGNIIKVLGEL